MNSGIVNEACEANKDSSAVVSEETRIKPPSDYNGNGRHFFSKKLEE